MSRLADPGVGDILDRLGILERKILEGGMQHHVDEAEKLVAMLEGRVSNAARVKLVLKLAAVNAALWQREEELRGYRRVGGGDGLAEVVCTVAFRIQELNDARAEVIRELNLAGGGEDRKEKL